MEFTTEEIELCKKIAKKHRKGIKYGYWFIYEDPDRISGFSNTTLNHHSLEPEFGNGKNILLWQISDCINFLESKGFDHIFSFIHFERGISFRAESRILDNPYKKVGGREAKTQLEACLKAVLVIVEEE